jgi:3-methyladenine DNA glycosylase AlkD
MGAKSAQAASTRPIKDDVQFALAWLKQKSTPHDYANLAKFGITANQAFGVSMANIQVLAKQLGRRHELAEALWETGWYEARMLTAFVGEPDRVTPQEMDRWCAEFDNWGICDTLCFKLWDQTPHAWAKVSEWSDRPEEFIKRASFALLASLAGHDKKSGDKPFLASLPLIERAAADDRNFVKKGVNWALRRVGGRSPVLKAASVKLAKRLAESDQPASRWVGKDALKYLTRPSKKENDSD